MDDKHTNYTHFVILAMFVVTASLVLLLLNEFRPKTPKAPRVIYRVTKTHDKHAPIISQQQLLKKMYVLQQMAIKQAMAAGDVQRILHQILESQSMGRAVRMPLGQDSFEWISNLAQDQAASMIRLLGNTSIADWHDEVMSLRMLSPQEQQRAIKIGRHQNRHTLEDLDYFYA